MAQTKQEIFEEIIKHAKKHAAEQAHKLSNDQQYWDLVKFARDHVGQATHDALQRFKWAEYSYPEGCAAMSYVLCSLLAVVNHRLNVSPEAMGEMAKERLIQIREEYKDEDEEDDDYE